MDLAVVTVVSSTLRRLGRKSPDGGLLRRSTGPRQIRIRVLFVSFSQGVGAVFSWTISWLALIPWSGVISTFMIMTRYRPGQLFILSVRCLKIESITWPTDLSRHWWGSWSFCSPQKGDEVGHTSIFLLFVYVHDLILRISKNSS